MDYLHVSNLLQQPVEMIVVSLDDKELLPTSSFEAIPNPPKPKLNLEIKGRKPKPVEPPKL